MDTRRPAYLRTTRTRLMLLSGSGTRMCVSYARVWKLRKGGEIVYEI